VYKNSGGEEKGEGSFARGSAGKRMNIKKGGTPREGEITKRTGRREVPKRGALEKKRRLLTITK